MFGRAEMVLGGREAGLGSGESPIRLSRRFVSRGVSGWLAVCVVVRRLLKGSGTPGAMSSLLRKVESATEMGAGCEQGEMAKMTMTLLR